MKAKHFASLAAAVLAAFLFFGTVTGCDTGGGPNGGTKEIPDLLVSDGGKFKSAYGDSYTFTKTAVSYDDNAGGATGGFSNAAVVGAKQFSGTAGVIVYQFPSGYRYPIWGGAPVAVLYGAVYYKNLAAQSVDAGSSYAANTGDVVTRTLSAPGSSLDGTIAYYFDPANEATEMPGGYGSYLKQ